MRAPCRVNLSLPNPLTVRHNTLHVLQIMIIVITKLSPPLCYFSCQEPYNVTLRKRQHGTLRICSIYLLKWRRIVINLVNIKHLVMYSTICGCLVT